MRNPIIFPQPPTDATSNTAQWMATLTARLRNGLDTLFDNYRGARVDTFSKAKLPPASDLRLIQVYDATSGPKYCVAISGAWYPITVGTTTVS